MDGRPLKDEALSALAALPQLPARQLQVFELHISGFSYDEISEKTGYSWTTVNRLMAKARKALRHLGGDLPLRRGPT